VRRGPHEHLSYTTPPRNLGHVEVTDIERQAQFGCGESNIHDQRADDFVARKCDKDARIEGARGYLASQDGRFRGRCIRHRLFVMRLHFREVRRESDNVSLGRAADHYVFRARPVGATNRANGRA
jgi:hypothetical protein